MESYACDNIELFNGDCLEVMRDLPDNSVDMVLCDLPYGVTQNRIDVVIPFDTLWKEYLRVGKENCAYVLFGQGLFYVDLVNSNRKMFKYDFSWNKELISGFLNAKKMPLRQHEQIAVFYRKQPTYNPQMTEGKPLHGMGTAYLTKKRKNSNYGDFVDDRDDIRRGETLKYPTTVLKFQKPHPSKALHPTEKPVALLEWLIRTYTNEGEVVLDNTMGSGSTGVAALSTGRKFIGIEKDSGIFEVAKERILNLCSNTSNSY